MNTNHKSPMPGVKPLTWSILKDRGLEIHLGQGLGFQYQVAAKVHEQGWVVLLREQLVTYSDTEEAAKAAAQADYESRVQEALIPIEAAGGMTDTVRAALEPFAKAWIALDDIAFRKNDTLKMDRAIFQTWGLKGTIASAQITIGDLKLANDVLEEAEAARDDGDTR